jgi:hypothetical protein
LGFAAWQILGIHNAPTYRNVMHAIIAEANAKGIPTYPVDMLVSKCHVNSVL